MTPAEQVAHLAEGAGLAARAGAGVLRIRGGEAVDFLQRMLTQDMKSFPPSQGRRASFTDRMAKMVAAGEFLRLDEGFLVVTDPGCAATFAAKLKVYVFGADVAFEVLEDEDGVLGLHGAGAAALLEGLGLPAPGPEPLAHVEGALEGATVHVAHSQRLGPGGFDLVVPAEAAPAVRAALVSAGAIELDEAVAEALRVEAGTPVFGVDYDGASMPVEVGLGESVSYNKGCYIGQEILERLRSRGKVTRLLRLVELGGEGEPPSGVLELTRDDKALGTLTSSCRSPVRGAWVGLASLPAAKAAPGDVLDLGGRAATVHALPGQSPATD